MGLTIYNASAGSGKTYTLAAAYISKLLTEEGKYLHRHILAVTFTNKATAEMKTRIMQWLWALSKEDGIDPDFVLKMCEITPSMAELYGIRVVDRAERILSPVTRRKIAQRAGIALRELVHDYNNFSVTTIDSFFQRVLADVAYELRLPSSYKLNLDAETVMEEAVEELLTTLETDPKAYNWLRNYMAQQINDNKSWNIREVLQQFGKRIFDERYLMFSQEVKDVMGDEAVVEQFRKDKEATKAKIKAHIKDIADQVEAAVEAAGYEVGALSYLGQALNKMRDIDLLACDAEKPINKSIIAELTSPEGPRLKVSGKKAYVYAGADLLLNFVEHFPQYQEAYTSAHLSCQHLYPMRMMSILDRIVGEINDKHSQFMLAKVGPFLQQMSQATGQESSFVFQKTGIRYHHIMIDEFQDTSNLQWRNFQFLFVEVLANSNTALIVGDGKQSIYRFRNGDWRIMQGLGNKEGVSVENLDTNYRSEPIVVTFNNTFFGKAAEWLDAEVGCGYIAPLYDTVEQRVRPDKPLHAGHVEVTVINQKAAGEELTVLADEEEKESEDVNTLILDQMEARILELYAQGVAFRDMAILVRKNEQASAIIDYFSQKPDCTLRFVSSEAFLLSASSVVMTIVQALRYACNRQDKVALAYLIKQLPSVSPEDYLSALDMQTLHDYLPEAYQTMINDIDKMPLYEVVEHIMVAFEVESQLCGVDESERAYLYAFLDEVMRFLEIRAEGIRGFLKHWEKEGHKRCIPMETTDAIQILTLHKSKGLEYHTVLIPFANWPIIEDRKDSIYWFDTNRAVDIHTNYEEYRSIPFLPIPASSRIRQTIYAEQHIEEHIMQSVDNINILYVAFTRAKVNLFVWGSVKYSTKSDGTLKTMGQLLHRWVCEYNHVDWDRADVTTQQWCAIIDEEFGERTPEIVMRSAQQAQTNRLEVEGRGVKLSTRVEHFAQNKLSFLQSTEAVRWLDTLDNEEPTAPKNVGTGALNLGKIVHEVLASIRTLHDAPEALARLEAVHGIKVSDGTERDQVEQIVQTCLSEPQAQRWFDGSWHLYNECSILDRTADGETVLRPDRVMVSADGSHIIVVDFKTGRPQAKYEEQVRQYMRLMQTMYAQRQQAAQARGEQLPKAVVEGYLWYIGEHYRSIEEITL